MTSDSVLVLGQMYEESQVAAVTDEQQQFLTEQEKALRANNDVEIRTLCKRGEIFAAVKAQIPHGGFMAWTADCRARWQTTEGRDGFGWSDETIQNYMNLYGWSALPDTTYHEYKHLGAGAMYFIARGVKQGKTPEQVLDTLRQKGLIADGEPTGDSFSTPPSANGTAPVVIQANDKISDAEKARIAQAVKAGQDERVSSVVERFGVRDATVVETLVSVAKSMDAAREKGIEVTDVFAEIESTGHIELPTGDQVRIEDASSREVQAAYVVQRKKTGADNHAGKTVLVIEMERDGLIAMLKEAGFLHETIYPIKELPKDAVLRIAIKPIVDITL